MKGKKNTDGANAIGSLCQDSRLKVDEHTSCGLSFLVALRPS